MGANLSEAHLNFAVLFRANLIGAYLRRADLIGVYLIEADLRSANFNLADLKGADFTRANLSGAYLSEADLSEADFRRANLTGADLSNADLSNANLSEADLSNAILSGANLNEVNLKGANLSKANLSGTNLSNANLTEATIIGTNLTKALLTDCLIFGISAWNVLLEGSTQLNLVITPEEEPTITIDNLKIAQFIYLLLNNAEIRDAIDTIGKKAVLILGRFTPERKAVLNALRVALRAKGYVPIVFDFDKPSSQDLTEMVSTLAHLSRFIIADLTDPSSIPYELHAVVPNRMIPVLPLLKESMDPLTGKAIPEFAMFGDLRRKYHWVLPIYTYNDAEDLLASLQAKVIGPAEQKVQELAGSDTRLGSSDAHTMSP